MHSSDKTNNNVPAFLTKLWRLVDDHNYDHLICWSPKGDTFIIRNQSQFSRDLLPLYFKHSNMASFIRQLNMYGFRKVVNVEQGGLKSDKDEMEFQHQCFLKDQETLLIFIKRKLPTGKGSEDIKVGTEFVNRMLSDVQQLKGHQAHMDTKFQSMKRENEALWREIANLRQKHLKQQQIVNKLVHFLLSLVQQNSGIGLKRKLPLLLDTSHPRDSKMPKLGRHISFDPEKNENISSNLGPVIHDITDLMESEEELSTNDNIVELGLDSNIDCTVSSDPIQLAVSEAKIPVNLVETPECDNKELKTGASFQVKQENNNDFVSAVQHDPPLSTVAYSELDETEKITSDLIEPIPLELALESVIGDETVTPITDFDPASDSALLPSGDLDFNKSLKADVLNHIESNQSELETLREWLAGSSYSLDTSTLLGVCSGSMMSNLLDEVQLFNPDESLPGCSMSNEFLTDDKNEIIGTELIQYNPSLMELTDEELLYPESTLFENEEVILPDMPNTSELQTPDPILSSPNLTKPSRRKGRIANT